MRVLFVTSELTPLAKVGGLGDVAGALPKALHTLGVDIRIVLPYYDTIDAAQYSITQLPDTISVETSKGVEHVRVSTTPLPGTSIPIYLLHNETHLSRGGVYFEKTAFVGSFKEIERFLFLSRAALALLPSFSDWWPDVIHCQDWHTATIPLFLKEYARHDPRYRTIKTLYTIHNLANQGRWTASEILAALGISVGAIPSLARQHGDTISLMEQGILNCDIVNTVSPTYAGEILTQEYGEGIEETLRERQKDLYGIVNGIDIDRFNPETDPDIASRYTVSTIHGKEKNKAALLSIVGLPETDGPLVGLVSRLTDQKGVDLVCAILDRLVASGGAGVFLGTGDPKLEEALTAIVRRHSKQLFVKIGFDAPLAQKIYAGADLFLMPSRFEPCGLGQMIAMRYGTLPIVRATGGLKDTVRDGETGFVFERYDVEELWKTVERAVTLFTSDQVRWRGMQEQAMQQDFSWTHSAQAYLRLYEKI